MPGPVLAVFESVRPPSVQLALPDGLTAEGLPYVSFDAEIPAGGLPSAATSQPATLAFANPQQMRFDFEVTLLAAANTAPVFSSSPLVFVTPQTTYQYAASAQDAELDLLTFGLDAAPIGMTVDPSTGLVSWYPTADQVGTHAVQLRVSDGRGGSAVQQYSLQVATVVNDVAPLVTSRPPLLATVGEPYQYALAVQDPNDTQFSFQLLAGPGDMAIDASTGIVRRFTPTLGDVGPQAVQLQVADPAGNLALQAYQLQVRRPNTPPEFTSSPVLEAAAGEVYRYNADAVDTEDAVTFSLATAPAGMQIDARSARSLGAAPPATWRHMRLRCEPPTSVVSLPISRTR